MCCIYIPDIARRQHLRSAGCHQLLVLRHQCSMFGHRPFLPLVRRPGTHYQTTYMTHHVPLTASARTRKLLRSSFTIVHSAFEAMHMLYKSTTDTDNYNISFCFSNVHLFQSYFGFGQVAHKTTFWVNWSWFYKFHMYNCTVHWYNSVVDSEEALRMLMLLFLSSCTEYKAAPLP